MLKIHEQTLLLWEKKEKQRKKKITEKKRSYSMKFAMDS